jgi:hypothetical protein
MPVRLTSVRGFGYLDRPAVFEYGLAEIAGLHLA